MTESEATGAGTEPATPERLLTGHSGRLLLAASLGWATIQTGRLVLSPMLLAVQDSLRISEFLAGVAFTVMWALYALLQFPSGRLSDRLTRKTLLVSGLGLVVAGFGLLASAPTYPLFLAGAAVVGVGAGLYPTAARALVSDLFVERRGGAFGLHTASGDLGGAAAAGLAVAALALYTWRAAYVPVVAVLAVVAVALHLQSREPYSLARVDLAAGATARRLLSARMGPLLVAYSLYAFAWQSAVAFLPSFLQEAKQFPPAVASGGFAALFVVGAVVKPAAGTLGDRVARETVAAGALLVAAAALVALLAVDGRLPVTAAVVLFAAGLMSFPPVMQAYLMDLFPDASMGGDLGAMRTVYIGLGSLGPAAVGYVAEHLSFAHAFVGILAGVVASAVIVVGVARG